MRLNQSQLEFLAKYFGDLSKILFASIVVGYFVPGAAGFISFITFMAGSGFATAFAVFSLKLLKVKI